MVPVELSSTSSVPFTTRTSTVYCPGSPTIGVEGRRVGVGEETAVGDPTGTVVGFRVAVGVVVGSFVAVESGVEVSVGRLAAVAVDVFAAVGVGVTDT